MNNIYCPNCGQSNDNHNTMCRACGSKIYQLPRNKDFYCPSCGARNTYGTPSCYNCTFDFSKLELLAPGQGKQNIAQEAVNKEEKSIFMAKGIYVVIGFILVAYMLITLFMPWFKNPMLNCDLIGYGNAISNIPNKTFWIGLSMLWMYMPFVALILAVISLIRKRIHSLVTYCSFFIPWLVGFVCLNLFVLYNVNSYPFILQSGEYAFVAGIVLLFLFDRLLYALKITKN